MNEEKDERVYSVWLSCCIGAGCGSFDAVSLFSSAKDFYEAGPVEWYGCGLFRPAQLRRMERRDFSEAQKIVRLCDENSWHIIDMNSEYYPVNLKDIPDAPGVLYAWGDAECLKNPMMIAVVGARDATRYSVEVTHRLTVDFAKVGVTVVSGGAVGIDTAAHRGALDGGGKTVAVMGCGLGAKYLSENEGLRRDIANHGAVISEFPPFSKPFQGSFPLRNRIISGLSKGTLVVEAGEHSGSLGTAKFARQQNREVFAVPGDVISSAFAGSNVLIANGARPVFRAEDVLYDFAYLDELDLSLLKSEPLRKPTKQKPLAPETLTEEQRRVYACFDCEPIGFDALVAKSGFSAPLLSQYLTELQIIGLVQPLPGKRFAVAD
ncbi:MAG TPA: DNA-protecting protein DprA [Ruminococcaceae bacterium]|nr:DNA-protecting protein DprA [Oscillospiraceae bacterium]